MLIIIIGCGRLGSELALRMSRRGNQVVVIDRVAASFSNLHPDFIGRTIEGDALNQDVLERANIFEADGLAAVTNIDALNATVAHVARIVYHVPNIIVRNYDPGWRRMHEAFGHQIVSSSSWGAQRIEELLYTSEAQAVFSAGNGEVEVYEFKVPAEWSGKRISELFSGIECIPVALTRAGQASLPEKDTILEFDDILNLSATLTGVETIRNMLRSTRKG